MEYSQTLRCCEEEHEKLWMELEAHKLENQKLQLKLKSARQMYDSENRLRIAAELKVETLKKKLTSVSSILMKRKLNLSTELKILHSTIKDSETSKEEYNDTLDSVVCVEDLNLEFEISTSSVDMCENVDENIQAVETTPPSYLKKGPKRKLKYKKITSSKTSLISPLEKENESFFPSPIFTDSDALLETTTASLVSASNKLDDSSTSTIAYDNTPTNTPKLSTKLGRKMSFSSECSSPAWSRTSSLNKHFKSLRNDRTHCFSLKALNFNKERCHACRKRLKIARSCFRCKYCSVGAHSDCIDNEAMPPCTAVAPQFYCLDDFVNEDSLRVPSIVIELTNEIEERGSAVAGLYAVEGGEREVTEIKNSFLRGGKTPRDLRGASVPVLCSALKAFLAGLSEPLIPSFFWRQLAEVEEQHEATDIHANLIHAVYKLPKTNRHTLAWIISHLQRISECAPCEMPPSDLAALFGPLFADPPTPLSPLHAGQDNQLRRVVEALLSVPCDYWDKILNVLEASFLSAYNLSSTLERSRDYSSVRRKSSFFSLGRSSPSV